MRSCDRFGPRLCVAHSAPLAVLDGLTLPPLLPLPRFVLRTVISRIRATRLQPRLADLEDPLCLLLLSMQGQLIPRLLPAVVSLLYLTARQHPSGAAGLLCLAWPSPSKSSLLTTPAKGQGALANGGSPVVSPEDPSEHAEARKGPWRGASQSMHGYKRMNTGGYLLRSQIIALLRALLSPVWCPSVPFLVLAKSF